MRKIGLSCHSGAAKRLSAPSLAEEEVRIKADQEARTRAEQEERVKAEEEARIKAEQEARTRAEQEARVKADDQIANFQKLGNEQLESPTPTATFLAPSFEAIAAATMDYSKKSLENGFVFVEKLRGAKSFQSAYSRTSYADFVEYLKKISELNTQLAKEAFKGRSHVA